MYYKNTILIKKKLCLLAHHNTLKRDYGIIIIITGTQILLTSQDYVDRVTYDKTH